MMSMLEKLINWYRVKKHNVKLGSNVQLNGVCLFTTAAGGEIQIGDNVTINSGEKYNRIGGDTRTIIQTIGRGKINIGSNVGISNCAMICRDSIMIEDYVFVGGVLNYMIMTFTPLITRSESAQKIRTVFRQNLSEFMKVHSLAPTALFLRE